MYIDNIHVTSLKDLIVHNITILLCTISFCLKKNQEIVVVLST